eukprot:m.7106 g.7106  ORF g.7106 m.7106 type:complete len:548 (+) comp2165_c0_seq2:144-1787(+)
MKGFTEDDDGEYGIRANESFAKETDDDTGILTEEGQSYRNVGVFSLLIIAFFWASGGIYGNEELLTCAPPATVFLGLIITPVIYSVPIALMTAELATALPLDGGLVAWVAEACGPTIGAHNSYWQWIAYIFDASVYPVLAGQYVSAEFDVAVNGDAETGVSLVALGIVWFVTGLKLLGTDVLVKFNTVLLVISIFPSLVYMLWGMAYLEPHTWTISEGVETNWSLLISWLLWLYSGFFSLGSLAGEVDRPKYTFPRVIMVLVPVVIIFNVTPLAVSTSLDTNWDNYAAGHFTKLAVDIAGAWLGYCFIIASNICLIGLYNAQTMTVERSSSFFVESVFSQGMSRLRKSKSAVVRYFFSKGRAGVPPFFILFTACITSCLIWLPYAFLVEFTMLLTSLVCMLFLASFVLLRYQRPDMPRPFKIPGGFPVAIMLSLLPLGCTSLNFYFSITDKYTEIKFVPFFKVFALEFFLGMGILVNFVYYHRRRIVGVYQSIEGKISGKSDADDRQPLIASSPASPAYSERNSSLHMKTWDSTRKPSIGGDGESSM